LVGAEKTFRKVRGHGQQSMAAVIDSLNPAAVHEFQLRRDNLAIRDCEQYFETIRMDT
jgi:hypothetical protein